MNAVYLLHFLFALIIVGGALRFVEYKWPEHPLVQAIGVIY